MHTTVIYLIHFDAPYKHARHYLGSTANLKARLEEHSSGAGARLMGVVSAAGIAWSVVRAWRGDKKAERRLKNLKEHTRLCPLCTPGNRRGSFIPALSLDEAHQ